MSSNQPLDSLEAKNMGGKKLKRILIHTPASFLAEFDQEIKGLYTSRNEAIRAGMILIIEDEKRRTTKKPNNTT